mmetsp:Transcript_13545/g.30299  ORF Transcript_13545/g.30299 Transcript_13545/m.30299 type:complete len:246 (+) Transcript_13545:128-865(+)
MILPVGGLGLGDEEVPVPSVIKHTHWKYWTMLVVLFTMVGILKCVAQDVMVGLVLGIMAVLIWCNLKDDCRRMNQCQLLWIGMLCLVQALFEAITLGTSVAGRTSRTQTQAPAVTEDGKTTTVITVTTEKHAFFEQEMGYLYNLQSAMMIATTITMLLGVLMAYLSYNAYETSLFNLDAAGDTGMGMGPMGGYGSYAGGGGGGGYGGQPAYAPGHSAGPTANGGAHARNPPRTQVFGGSGNRLGG